MITFVFWGNCDGFADIIGLTGPAHIAVSDSASAIQALKKGGQESLLFVAEGVPEQDPRGFARAIKESKLPVTLVYKNASTTENLTSLLTFSDLNHIVPSDSDNTKALVSNLVKSNKPVNAAMFVPTQLIDPREIKLTATDQFEDAYKDIQEYAVSLKCFVGFESIVATTASELLTNAFYNGKRDPNTGLAIVVDRSADVHLKDGEVVTLSYGHDAEYFWLIVTDLFGTLDRGSLINSMIRAAVERVPKMDTPGGAGLGMIMLYEWSSELNIFIQPGRSTRVACKLKMTKRNRQFEAEPSAIHILVS